MRLGPIEIIIKEDGSGTRGRLSIAEFRGKGFRIPPHTHTEHDENIVVVEGTLGVLLGTKTYTLHAGDSFTIPVNVPHSMWNESDQRASFLNIIAPARYLEYFRELSLAATERLPPPEAAKRHHAEVRAAAGGELTREKQAPPRPSPARPSGALGRGSTWLPERGYSNPMDRSSLGWPDVEGCGHRPSSRSLYGPRPPVVITSLPVFRGERAGRWASRQGSWSGRARFRRSARRSCGSTTSRSSTSRSRPTSRASRRAVAWTAACRSATRAARSGTRSRTGTTSSTATAGSRRS